MIIRKNSLIVVSFAAIFMLSGSVLAGTVGIAQAVLISEEEHWKYHVDRWLWDGDRRRTYGLITPQIVIQNETADRLEGFVADANGTRLAIYDGEQVVMVRFLSETGPSSGWQMTGRVHDGYFAIDIPRNYREAETVRIHIGNHEYTVNNATPTTPQTQVFINSAMTMYRTSSTLVEVSETQIAQAEQKPFRSIFAGGSLIDWILSQNGMLPVRSPDSGK